MLRKRRDPLPHSGGLWCLPSGYQQRAEGIRDAARSGPSATGPLNPAQKLAIPLARRFGVRHLVHLGPHGDVSLSVAATDDLAALADTDLPDSLLADSLVLCAGALEQAPDPGRLLELMGRWSAVAPATLIATTERDHTRGWGDLGPPAEPSHFREWTLSEFGRLLEQSGLGVDFLGMAPAGGHHPASALAVCGGRYRSDQRGAPRRFRVLAVMPTYNEEDMVVPTIASLLSAGIEVHVIDHQSTDRTFERVQALPGQGRLTWERFPEDGAQRTFRWAALLTRAEEVAVRSGADWCLLHPADERRSGPWPGIPLRDALYRVQQDGFNAVDHTRLNFRPVDATAPAGDPAEMLRYFTFGDVRLPSVRVNAWRNTGNGVRLVDHAGRDVRFPGRRVYPYNFLIKHYPVRSASHGERKVRDRGARWDPVERSRQWPRFEDHRDPHGRFYWDPAAAIEFDDSFMPRYLAERLCGGPLEDAHSR